ncbi:MAG TPA: RNA-binding protein [Rhodopseudomonas sp.]|uniref:RNA-binding protein n=1 Tax=Rhodopseudomonas sp. TaxID=1078 RepID=UPI002EDABAB0
MLASADPADLDNGPRTARSGTERMCVVSRDVRPVDELIRFVVAPTGELVPDLKRKLPGRGLWVTASHQAVAEAARRNLFAKGFKRELRGTATLAADTDALMLRGVIEALAMAAKAGQVVSGFSKVEAALTQREAVALLHALDGAADGIRKLDAVARQNDRITTESQEFPVVTFLTSAELDLALGRSNVIHAALLGGAAGNTFLSRSQILVKYRLADDSTTANKFTAKTVRARTA